MLRLPTLGAVIVSNSPEVASSRRRGYSLYFLGRQVARQREEAAATFQPELNRKKEQEKLKRSLSQVTRESLTGDQGVSRR
jgi:hypothetical protein